jgi:N-acetylneuraminic acid mutarotase
MLVATILNLVPMQTAAAAASLLGAAALNTARAGHTATLLPNGKVLVAGGMISLNEITNTVEIYDPASNTWTMAAAMNIARAAHTATLLANGKVLVTGGIFSPAGVTFSAEIYDPDSDSWSPANNMLQARAYHTATLLENGSVLIAGGSSTPTSNGGSALASVEIYDPDADTWSAAAAMGTAVDYHAAVRMPDGKVMVTGGFAASGMVTLTAIYDPDLNSWSAAAPMNTARAIHSAFLLPNGKVVVVNGTNIESYDPAGNQWTQNNSAELSNNPAVMLPNGSIFSSSGFLFNPETNGVAATPGLPSQTLLTMTLLPSGQVLMVGGAIFSTPPTISNNVYLYDDPARGSWATVTPLSGARARHTVTPLLTGKVLVAGGWTNGDIYIKAAEIFDANSNTWSSAGALTTGRRYHTATLLSDGRVLLTGGLTSGDTPLASVELYDPESNTWSNGPPMLQARSLHTATLLADGCVLITGGYNTSGVLNTAELFDPVSNTWSAAASLNTARRLHTATLLPDGKVLVAGGIGSGYLSSVEIYTPQTAVWSPAPALATARAYHTAALLPTGKILVAGGYNGAYLSSAELFDPDPEVFHWTAAAALSTARNGHSMLVLPNGQVLVAGGYGISGYLSSTEIYSPAANTWGLSNAQIIAHSSASAAILPDGRVLVAGGETNGAITFSAEAFDLSTGVDDAWRPQISGAPAQIGLEEALIITGSGFRGYHNMDSGGSAAFQSSTAFPLIQVRRLDNEQITWLPLSAFSAESCTVQPAGLQPGPAMLTVFVNGIPSHSALVHIGTDSARSWNIYLPAVVK